MAEISVLYANMITNCGRSQKEASLTPGSPNRKHSSKATHKNLSQAITGASRVVRAEVGPADWRGLGEKRKDRRPHPECWGWDREIRTQGVPLVPETGLALASRRCPSLAEWLSPLGPPILPQLRGSAVPDLGWCGCCGRCVTGRTPAYFFSNPCQ